jgi:hypothetical protein
MLASLSFNMPNLGITSRTFCTIPVANANLERRSDSIFHPSALLHRAAIAVDIIDSSKYVESN